MSGPTPKVSAVFKLKETVVKTSLLALGVTFELVSNHSPELQEELRDWDEGRILALGVLPDGPYIAVRKEAGALKYLGKGHHNAQLKILFKNMDAAFMMLSGQIGSHTGFAEHRAIVHGSLYQAMEANRAMAIVTKFLFPGIMLKGIVRRMPKMTAGDLVLKARVMATLTPALLMNMTK